MLLYVSDLGKLNMPLPKNENEVSSNQETRCDQVFIAHVFIIAMESGNL